jgi:hypothetical protein
MKSIIGNKQLHEFNKAHRYLVSQPSKFLTHKLIHFTLAFGVNYTEYNTILGLNTLPRHTACIASNGRMMVNDELHGWDMEVVTIYFKVISQQV